MSGESSSMPAPKSLASLASIVVDRPPSCLEFSPKYHDYFVIGTYELETEDNGSGEETITDTLNNVSTDATRDVNSGSQIDGVTNENVSNVVVDGTQTSQDLTGQSRSGSLMLFHIEQQSLVLVHTIACPSAILDLHFDPHQPETFMVASSTGSVSRYTLAVNPKSAIIHLGTWKLRPESTLILSFSWHRSFPGLFGTTFSTGTVGLYQYRLNYANIVELHSELSNHQDNVWTLAFAPTHDPRYHFRTQGLYSGGDDSKVRCVTVKRLEELKLSGMELSHRSTAGLAGIGGHGSGVTAILPLPFDIQAGKNILLTGSYDDNIRVLATFDHRTGALTKLPKVLCELNLGGGVWRLKFLKDYPTIYEPFNEADNRVYTFRVLASCMFVGARIVEVRGSKRGEWKMQVLAKFEEHDSMCYASDVEPSNNDVSALCVSSSFYDRKVCLWRFD